MKEVEPTGDRGFDSIRGQDAPIRLLGALLAKQRLPHALLFSGIDGIGKFTTAKMFAMAVNCENRRQQPRGNDGSNPLHKTHMPVCGHCRACRLIGSGKHPDFHIVEPDGLFIRIAQVRELLRIFSLKPHGAGYRVAIFRDAHAMNPEAANALLKMLEEPPARSLLMLTANRLSDLLPTIVSRCQTIRFRPLSRETVTDLLRDIAGLEKSEVETLAILSQGSISRAMALHEAGWVRQRMWFIDAIENLGELPMNARLALAEFLAKDREQMVAAIDVATGWFRDLAVVSVAPGALENKDLADRASRSASRLGPERIDAALRVLLKAARAITGSANIRLTAEVMMMRLASLHGAI